MGVFETIGDSVCDLCADMYNSAVVKLAEVGSTVSEISKTDGSLTGTIWGSLEGMVTNVIDGLKPFGYAICVLFFLIALLELAMSERMTLEFFVKFFSKLVIGFCAVYFANDIWEACVEVGNSLGDLMASLFTIDGNGGSIEDQIDTLGLSKDALYQKFTDYVGDNGANMWIPLLFKTISLVVPMRLAAVVLTIVAYVVAFTRILELCIRGAFLPIACSLLSDDGWRGAGGRYLRKFLAICSQSAVLVAIGNITTGIMITATSAAVGNVGGDSDIEAFNKAFEKAEVIMFGVGLASISIMFKSIGLINDVFGG